MALIEGIEATAANVVMMRLSHCIHATHGKPQKDEELQCVHIISKPGCDSYGFVKTVLAFCFLF